MTMHFNFDLIEATPLEGDLVYRAYENSIDFEARRKMDVWRRMGADGIVDLLVADLQIETGVETGELLYIWGYHPQHLWEHRSLPVPDLKDSGVRVRQADVLSQNINQRIAAVSEWVTTYDEATGWIRVARPDAEDEEDCYCFASNTAVGLVGSDLNSLWLRPVFVASPDSSQG